MKSKKYILSIVLAALIIARMAIVFFENENVGPPISDSTSVTVTQLNPDANLSKTPNEAVTSLNSTTPNSACQSLRSKFQNLSEVRKIEKTSVRFVNIHKKIDGIVYRTRFFYKDSSENDIPTYLLYREDKNEDDYLIETSSYKKGPQYLKIEKSEGTILYSEEGVNVGIDQDLFLHYENKELKDLQGVNASSGKKDFVECRF